jgi:hypothetical protein
MQQNLAGQAVALPGRVHRLGAVVDLDEVVERVAAVAGQLKRTVRRIICSSSIVSRRQGRSPSELSLGL